MRVCSTKNEPLTIRTGDGYLIKKGMTVYWTRSPNHKATVVDVCPELTRVIIDGAIEYNYPQKCHVAHRNNIPASTFCIFVEQRHAFIAQIAKEEKLIEQVAGTFKKNVSRLTKQLNELNIE